MKAAIYARKSTDDNDKTLDNKSVERQKEHAIAFANCKGWTVEPEYIYVDDGISGAEYVNRPGLFKMLNDIKSRPFHALIMSEPSRLGRDMTRTSYFLTEIIEAEVDVWYYLTNEQEKADTPEAKIMMTLKSYASEVERQKASVRSRDALKKKAEKGYNAGGVCYGYDNVPVYGTGADGERVKSHTDYKINEQEADIIRRMFRMYLDGHGHTVAAKTLNGDPRYQKYSLQYFDGKTPPSPWKGTGSWSPSSIWSMLRNERYIGQIPWGEFRNEWRGGTQKRKKQSEFLHATRKDLEIVPEELWNKVQKRIKQVKESYIRDNNGNLWGRPDSGQASQYLLSGLVRCGNCGANMIATYIMSGHEESTRGRWKDYRYQCSYNSRRGEKVCDNRLKPRMKEMDALVLDAIKDSVLNPNSIRYVVTKAMEEIARLQKTQPEKGESLQDELRKTEKELNNLVSIIASGAAPKTILQEIRKREAKVEALKTELTHYTAPARMNDLDYKRLEKDLTGRLGRFQELIYSDIPVARQALRKLLREPLILTTKGKDYILQGETRLGALFTETNEPMASPTGVEPVSPP